MSTFTFVFTTRNEELMKMVGRLLGKIGFNVKLQKSKTDKTGWTKKPFEYKFAFQWRTGERFLEAINSWRSASP